MERVTSPPGGAVNRSVSDDQRVELKRLRDQLYIAFDSLRRGEEGAHQRMRNLAIDLAKLANETRSDELSAKCVWLADFLEGMGNRRTGLQMVELRPVLEAIRLAIARTFN